MIRLLIVGILYLFTGCVSIETFERSKVTSFEYGQKEMAQRVLVDFKTGVPQDEITKELKEILEMWR